MSVPQTITGSEIGLLSYLFEAVGELLTPEQRQELTDQLTSLRPAGVAPGDLITADLFNAMLNNINDLLARVAVLEGADGAPIITGIIPSGAPVMPNSLMTIVGMNFDVEPNRNMVRLGDAVIVSFREGSDNSQLTFTVPDVFTGLPKFVDAVVETGGRQSNRFPVSMAPAPRQQIGEFVPTPVAVSPGVVNPGAILNFSWDVFADTVLDDEMRLRLAVGSPVGATEAQWRSDVTFTPESPVPIDARDTLRIEAAVRVPAGASRANLGLEILGIQDQATGNSPVVQWIAGFPIQTSSPLALLDFVIPADDGSPTTPLRLIENMNVGGINYPKGIRIRQGQNGIVRFTRTDARPSGSQLATYQYNAAFEGPNGGNTIMNNPTPAQHTGVARGNSNTFSIRVGNTSGAVDSVSFLRVGASQTVNSGGLEPFTSFTSIPLIIIS